MAKRLPPVRPQSSVREIRTLSDLQLDTSNANAHTERGVGMLERSLRQYGAGRSILVDREGRVIAGAATLERAVDLGLGMELVRTRGDKLVVVQREDLDLNDDACADARELAIADNRIAEVDLAWDAEMLKALQAKDTDLTAFFLDDELADLLEPGKKRERVAFDAERKICLCCKRKCRKSCGCYQEG